jgi:hypothetical protein
VGVAANHRMLKSTAKTSFARAVRFIKCHPLFHLPEKRFGRFFTLNTERIFTGGSMLLRTTTK